MADIQRGERFIFVGGAPRSGTTLVQNMLDSHPDICGAPEFLHLRDIINLKDKLQSSVKRGWIDLICSSDDVDSSTSSFIENILLPLADKNGCKFLSEKTPENTVVFPQLINLLPAAHFIHVVRDPRAVIASLLNVGKRAAKKEVKSPLRTTNLRAAINHTKNCLECGFAASKLAPDKVLTVIYEQLVVNSEVETKKICEFLEIEWSSNMMKPGSFKHLGEKAITTNSNEVWYDPKTYNSNPDKQRIEQWKSRLKPTQQVAIAMSFQDFEELTQLGYNFSIDNLSLVNRFLGSTYNSYLHLRNNWRNFEWLPR